jgi:hypothetical protein
MSYMHRLLLTLVDQFPEVGLMRLELWNNLFVVAFVGVARTARTYSVFKRSLTAVTCWYNVIKCTLALFQMVAAVGTLVIVA